MSLQEMPCTESALAFRGAFKLMHYSLLLQEFIKTLEDNFVSPQANWSKINRLLGLFGKAPIISAGSPSKNEDVGDGTKSLWQAPNSTLGCIVVVFNACEAEGLLINPDDVRVTFTATPDKAENTAISWWRMIFSRYKIAKEKEMNMMILGYTIASYHNSEAVLYYSPAQIAMYRNPLIGNSVNEPGPYDSNGYTVLAIIPWDTINKYLAPVWNALSSPWKQSFGNIELVELKYGQESTTINVTELHTKGSEGPDPDYESTGEDDPPPMIFTSTPVTPFGSDDVYCIESMLVIVPKTVSDPNYEPEDLGPEDEPDPEYPAAEELTMSVPPCYGKYGSREVDPNPDYDFYSADFSDDNWFCGDRDQFYPEYREPGSDPEDPPQENVTISEAGCPYSTECQEKVQYINPFLIDRHKYQLNFGWPDSPEVPLPPVIEPPDPGDPEWFWQTAGEGPDYDKYIEDGDFIVLTYNTVSYK